MTIKNNISRDGLKCLAPEERFSNLVKIEAIKNIWCALEITDALWELMLNKILRGPGAEIGNAFFWPYGHGPEKVHSNDE